MQPPVRLPGVFRPVRDAYLLIEHLDRESLAPGAVAVDLCTGTGIIAVAAARHGATVTAVDLSRRALLSTRANAALAGVALRTRRGDLFAPLGGVRADVVTANPPYLPTVGACEAPRGASRAWEGGLRGRDLIDRICDGVSGHLRPGGVLLMVHSSLCGTHETLTRLRAHGLSATVTARETGPLGPLVRRRRGALRTRGLLARDQEHEDLVVIRAVAPRPEPDAPVSRCGPPTARLPAR